METQDIVARFDAMRLRATERDQRQRDILSIRAGDYEDIAGDLLPEAFDKPLVSNLIDTAAHDLSEVMAPLPTVSCMSSAQTSDKAKKVAEKRSLIANSYVQRSGLAEQMYLGADRYGSFGYMAYLVEPDYAEKTPFVRVDDAVNSYFACDYRERVAQYATVHDIHPDELRIIYPELAQEITNKTQERDRKEVEVVTWRDKRDTVILVPEWHMELDRIPHAIGRCPVRLVRRPNINPNETKGQFDDVIWVQIARAMVAAYTMSAVEQSVNAPIALPNDADELEIGPNAVIQSAEPEKIGRVPLNMPQGLFPEQQMLEMAQRVGMRYPEGRTGNFDASIVTGQGVQALMGTFDTQVQTFQKLNEFALHDVISMCFEMDETLWPERKQSVRVRDNGSPVEITYVPSKDISGDWSVDVSYGAVAGLDPNRSLIFLLQATAGGFLSKETARRHMPVDIDQVAEEKRMGLEMFRESLTASIAALPQALPMMASQGMDPRQVVTQFADVMKRYQKGDTIEEAVSKVFAPKEKEGEQQAAPADPLAAILGGAGGGPEGGAPSPDMAAAPTGEGSAGSDLLMMLGGMTPGGSPNLQANVSRRQPAR